MIFNGVVFLGTVASVTERSATDDSSVLDIGFHTQQWFLGSPQEHILVRGLITHRFLTDCHGVFDFSPKVGDQWLMFGQISEDQVVPDTSLSVKVQNGAISSSILRQLR